MTAKENSDHYSQPIRVYVVGAENVGKSAILVRFLTQRFIGQYQSQQDMKYCYNSNVYNKPQFEFIDVAKAPGKGFPVQIAEEAFFIIVYDICSQSSFGKASNLLVDIQKFRGSSKVALIGNKLDLGQNRRQVSKAELNTLAQSYGAFSFETSAVSDGSGVKFAIDNCLKSWSESKVGKVSANEEVARKPHKAILSSLSQMFNNHKQKRRKPYTL